MNEQNWESRIIDLILKARSRRRKYAHFFEWPDKAIKEKGIVCDLLEAMTAKGENHGITGIRSKQPDPPDCVGIGKNGESIAFEVTELVDEETILRNQSSDTDWKDWSGEDLLGKVQAIVKEKDAKIYNGEPYSKIILVIHTDEPLLRLTDCVFFLRNQSVGQCKQITDCYLLMSYSPSLKAYPYFKLGFARLE